MGCFSLHFEYLFWDLQKKTKLYFIFIFLCFTTLSMDTFYHKTHREDFYAFVISSGLVIWNFGGIFSTSCSLQITHYPFDSQTCGIDMHSWSYTTDMVDLKTDGKILYKWFKINDPKHPWVTPCLDTQWFQMNTLCLWISVKPPTHFRPITYWKQLAIPLFHNCI